MSSNIQIPKVCQHCGNSFVARTTVTRYCSKQCNSRAYKKQKRDEKVKATLKETKETLQGVQTLQSPQSSTLHSKQYLSVQEAANLIGTSRWTIQRMIKREQLKAAKFGRRTIIAKSEIDNLFN
jgi:excisionase family DNA binding protein